MADAVHPLDTRIGELRKKLNARQGNPALKKSCEAIQAQIDRIEAAKARKS